MSCVEAWQSILIFFAISDDIIHLSDLSTRSGLQFTKSAYGSARVFLKLEVSDLKFVIQNCSNCSNYKVTAVKFSKLKE